MTLDATVFRKLCRRSSFEICVRREWVLYQRFTAKYIDLKRQLLINAQNEGILFQSAFVADLLFTFHLGFELSGS